MYLGYIHYFRALAIFFIVAGHSIDFFTWSDNQQNIERALRILISNGSVIFVFIAGYLFQHLLVKYQHKKYFIGKFKNVILPYILVSIPAVLIFVVFMQRDTVWSGFYDEPLWLQAIYFYLTGFHLAPLWFIPMIALFYIAAPLLVKLDKMKGFYLILPLAMLLSCFVGRGLPVQSFIHFFSVYLLGMYCSHYKAQINEVISTTKFLVIFAALVIGLAISEFIYMQGTMTFLNYLQKMSMSMFFLALFIRAGERLNFKVIRTIADTSFGVFFIHSYVLTATKMTIVQLYGDKIEGSILLFPFVALSTLLICVGIIVLIQKLLGNKSRYLVGS